MYIAVLALVCCLLIMVFITVVVFAMGFVPVITIKWSDIHQCYTIRELL